MTLKKNDTFDILNEISGDVTLVKLMDSRGNMKHAISIVRNWIFDSNYEKALFFTQESLDIICFTSIDEELITTFQSVFMLLDTSGYQIILK